MITKLSVSHYKSLESVSVDFTNTNVIVGQNGAGKSNIVDALSFVADAVRDDLDSAIMKRHGIESIRQWTKYKPFDISIEVEFSNGLGSGKYGFSIKSGRGAYRVSEEHGEWIGMDPFTSNPSQSVKSSFKRKNDLAVKFELGVNLPKNRSSPPVQLPSSDLYLTTISSSIFSIESIVFRPIADELRNFVLYSIYPNTLREPRAVSRETRLMADGSNLPSIVRKMTGSHRTSKSNIVDAIKVILPHIDNIQIKTAGGFYVPVLEGVATGGDTHQFNMSQVSDGTLRILGILSALYQVDTPRIIALEEPEQMIHPGALPVLAEAMDEYVNGKGASGRQLFVTTHSPVLLDLFKPDNIVWTTFANGVTECGRVQERHMHIIRSKLYSAGEIFLTEGFAPE